MNLITVQKIVREKGIAFPTFNESKTVEEYNKNRPAFSSGALSEMEFNTLKTFFTKEAK